MKRLFFTLFLLLFSLGALAQYAVPGTVTRSGTHLKVDGERISPEQQILLLSNIDGTDFNPAWNKAVSGRNLGIGLTVGGGVAALGGGALTLIGIATSVIGAATGAVVGSIGGPDTAHDAAESGASAGKPYTTAGLITAGAGIVALGAGIPMIISNNRRLNGIALSIKF